MRTNHATDTCLSRLTDMIFNGAENGKHASAVLIDLQKVFDTLDHTVSLDKLKCTSFSDKVINRAFFVSLDN